MSGSLVIFLAVLVLAVSVLVFFRAKRKKPSETVAQQVYVGNLPYRVGEAELRSHFTKYGTVSEVRIIRHPRSGRSKGYAFISYINPKHASRALQAHSENLYGRSIVVRAAKPKQYEQAN